MGKKIMDIKMRRDASRGRKSKAGGREIKSDSIIYSPVDLRKKGGRLEGRKEWQEGRKDGGKESGE